MRDTLNITNNILRKYGLRANKRFGQNFLIDDTILEEICIASNITSEDLVIEIGPGLGNLTEYILDKAKYALLIEIDSKMIEILKDRFDKISNFNLINDDILQIDIDKKIEELEQKNNVKCNNVKVVANLPYYITTPILFKLLQDSKKINEIIVMVQKEVAERMVATPKGKEYGILTLMIDYYSDAKIEFTVPSNSFIPEPGVTSSVVRLLKNKKYNVSNEELFFGLIHKAFAQRRKKLTNSLESTGFNNMDKQELISVLKKCGISEMVRAEELSIQDYINIVEVI